MNQETTSDAEKQAAIDKAIADARNSGATADKAEAEAKSAATSAEKSQLELGEWSSEAAIKGREATTKKLESEALSASAAADKAAAEAQGTELTARKSEQELSEWTSPWAKEQRAAVARKDTAEAKKAEAEARVAEIAAYLPDLSGIEVPALEIKGEQALFAGLLAGEAISLASQELAKKITSEIEKKKLLITDNPDLASSDMAYFEVTNGLQQLKVAATNVLQFELEAVQAADAGAAAVLGALAATLPSAISLMVPKRTLASFAGKPERTAVLASVAGALQPLASQVRLDDFRILPQGEVAASDADLQVKRGQLIQKKLLSEASRSNALAEQAVLEAELEAIAQGEVGTGDPNRRTELKRGIALNKNRSEKLAVLIGVIDSVVTSIDAFSAGIHKAPEGSRSLFASAALREDMRNNGIDLMLFVTGSSGSTDQLISDMPLWSKDKYHVLAHAAISYWLCTPEGDIQAAGVASATSDKRGTIG